MFVKLWECEFWNETIQVFNTTLYVSGSNNLAVVSLQVDEVVKALLR